MTARTSKALFAVAIAVLLSNVGVLACVLRPTSGLVGQPRKEQKVVPVPAGFEWRSVEGVLNAAASDGWRAEVTPDVSSGWHIVLSRDVVASARRFWTFGTERRDRKAAIGTCDHTKIISIAPRLEGNPASGISLRYDNGGSQVSYNQDAAVLRSVRGDEALVCLVSIPENCPPDDDRGKVYTATNLRTMESWTMSDSQHSCGGA